MKSTDGHRQWLRPARSTRSTVVSQRTQLEVGLPQVAHVGREGRVVEGVEPGPRGDAVVVIPDQQDLL